MPSPVESQILSQIKSRLQEISTATDYSGNGDYYHTNAGNNVFVEKPFPTDAETEFSTYAFQIVVLPGEIDAENNNGNDRIDCLWAIDVIAYYIPADRDAQGDDGREYLADIEAAVTKPLRGGIAKEDYLSGLINGISISNSRIELADPGLEVATAVAGFLVNFPKKRGLPNHVFL